MIMTQLLQYCTMCIHMYKTKFGSTVNKSTGPKKEINARPQDFTEYSKEKKVEKGYAKRF